MRHGSGGGGGEESTAMFWTCEDAFSLEKSKEAVGSISLNPKRKRQVWRNKFRSCQNINGTIEYDLKSI